MCNSIGCRDLGQDWLDLVSARLVCAVAQDRFISVRVLLSLADQLGFDLSVLPVPTEYGYFLVSDYLSVSRQLKNNRNRVRSRYGLTEHFTWQEWLALLKKTDWSCQFCYRSNVKLTIEHIKPLCLGGLDTIDNIAVACPECNAVRASVLNLAVV